MVSYGSLTLRLTCQLWFADCHIEQGLHYRRSTAFLLFSDDVGVNVVVLKFLVYMHISLHKCRFSPFQIFLYLHKNFSFLSCVLPTQNVIFSLKPSCHHPFRKPASVRVVLRVSVIPWTHRPLGFSFPPFPGTILSASVPFIPICGLILPRRGHFLMETRSHFSPAYGRLFCCSSIIIQIISIYIIQGCSFYFNPKEINRDY